MLSRLCIIYWEVRSTVVRLSDAGIESVSKIYMTRFNYK